MDGLQECPYCRAQRVYGQTHSTIVGGHKIIEVKFTCGTVITMDNILGHWDWKPVYTCKPRVR